MKCNGQKPRFSAKNNNENERALLASWWEEATQVYGTTISYFVHGYTLSGHDFLYGENPTSHFKPPVEMLALAQLNNDALLLSKFGIQTDAELTVVIPYTIFGEAMGLTAEPKSGDLVVLSELGWDRPSGGGYPYSYPSSQISAQTALGIEAFCYKAEGGVDDTLSGNNFLSGGYPPYDAWLRGPNVYEITERRDENVPGQFNPLMGHFVWILKAKRFDYSYEPDAPVEHGSDQIHDGTLYGKLSGGASTPTPEKDKKYDQNVSDETKKSWDYEESGNLDKIYGDYG